MSEYFYCLSDSIIDGLMQEYLTNGRVVYPLNLLNDIANEENQ